MTDDGSIDYSKFAGAQLVEALSRIDRSRYPRNFEALKRELDSRGPEAIPVIHTTLKRRPLLVWLIVIAYAFDLLFLIAVACVVIPYWDSIPEAAKAGLKALSTTSWTAAAIGVATTLLGTVQLFRMKRSAFYLFSAGTVLALISTVHGYVTGPLRHTGSWMIGVGFTLLTWWYVWCLYRKKMLN